MDINEEIRFRVVDEVFTDLSPAGPEMSGEKKSTDDTENKRSPYTITVSHFAIVEEIELSIVSKSPNKGLTGWLDPWEMGYSLHDLYLGICISNKGEWNNCFSKFSNRVLPPIVISTILQSEKFQTWRYLAHYFPYDVKL